MRTIMAIAWITLLVAFAVRYYDRIPHWRDIEACIPAYGGSEPPQ